MNDCPLCRGGGQVDPNDNSVTLRMLQLMVFTLEHHMQGIIKEEQAKAEKEEKDAIEKKWGEQDTPDILP